MSFHDLPTDWPNRTLRDRDLACDVVDLFVRDADRAGGCVSLLLCDGAGRLIQPVTVGEIPARATPADRRLLFDGFLGHLGGSLQEVVVAIGRAGSTRLTDGDREWHQAALSAGERSGVRVLGVYLATPAGVTSLPRWDESLAS